MKRKNVMRFDSKGRVLIPSHLRKSLKAGEGTEVIIIPDEKNGSVKLVPMLKSRTAEIRFLIEDTPGSLARVAGLLSRCGLDIMLSESRNLTGGKVAEWDVIVDVSGCDDLDAVKGKFLELDNVRDVQVLRAK
jgi:bifunctional DNA-binding transcriptional regulator/antitoxin component of YhaV-PrlF toxin-antitoxin module